MAKESKPREPTWQERAAKLSITTAFPDHEGTEPRPVPGKRCWLENTTLVLVVYDMQTKTWASESEKALYQAASSQAHGAARPSRIEGAVSMGVEFVVRNLSTTQPIRYRIPPTSKLKWYRSDRPPKAQKEPEPKVVVDTGTAYATVLGKNRFISRCPKCWAAGHHEHSTSTHSSFQEAEKAAKAHKCI